MLAAQNKNVDSKKIPETATTVTAYVQKPRAAKHNHIFHVVFFFDKSIPGLQTVDICGTFTLWKLVRLTRVEDVTRGVFYHTTLQVPAGVHHYRFKVQVEKVEGAKTLVQEYYIIDEDYSSKNNDEFGEALNVLDLAMGRHRGLHNLIEKREKWVVPKHELEGRVLLTSSSGHDPGRLPQDIVVVMQKYEEMNTKRDQEEERKALQRLRKRSVYLYNVEMEKKRKKKHRIARMKRGVDPKSLPSPAVYGILPNSERGRQMMNLGNSATVPKVKKDHIPRRRSGARLIGALEKCPAVSVFEMEDRVKKILGESRAVASKMPKKRNKFKTRKSYKNFLPNKN
jgi:hypothetical protein